MNSSKLSDLRSLIIWILILSHLITVSGCMTTETRKVEPDALRTDLLVIITEILLTSGKVIDCSDKFITFNGLPDTSKSLKIQYFDTVKVNNSGRYNVVSKTDTVAFSDIVSLKFSDKHIDVGMTVLVALGILSVAAVLLTLILFVAVVESIDE
ncbi:MAG: hypothetical protein IPG02_05055 [Ignavibacteria bacterium]|nr:hypothetical protein [Ignavibacteria bacterium]